MRRARFALALLLVSGLQFQCGTPCSATPYVAQTDGDVPVSAEFQYFDEGLCTGFCRRLKDCGTLCLAISSPPADCTNDSPAVFEQCMHGAIRTEVFGLGACPHACPVSTFRSATPCDAVDCGSDVYARTCNMSGRGSIGDFFREGSMRCVSVCR